MMNLSSLGKWVVWSGMLGLSVLSAKAQLQVATTPAVTNIARVEVQSHGKNFFTEPSDFSSNFIATTNGISLIPGIGAGITNVPTAEGQLLISSNATWITKNLTAGTGILITNTAGDIEISVSAAAGGNVPLAGDVIMTGGLTNNVNLSVVRTGTPTIGLNINQSASLAANITQVGGDIIWNVDGSPRINFNQGTFGQVTFGQAGAELYINGELGFNNNDRIYFGASDTAIIGNATADTLIFNSGAGENSLTLDNGGMVWLGSSTPVVSPLARIFGVEGSSGTDVAGVNLTIRGGQSTGSGTGGDLVFQTSPAGGSGTLLNSYVTALTINDDGTLTLANPLTLGNGGVGFTTYAKGDLIYASATNTLGKLAIGTTGYLLTSTNGAVEWLPSPASAGGEANTASNQGTGTVAFFAAKSGIDLTFNSFSSGNSLLTLTSNANVITATVNESTIDHNNLANYAVNRHYPVNDGTFSTTTLLSGTGISNHVSAVVTGIDLIELNDYDSGSQVSGSIPVGTSGGKFKLSLLQAGSGIVINNSSGLIEIATVSGSPASTLNTDLIDGWLLSEADGLDRLSLNVSAANLLTNHSGNVNLSSEGVGSVFAGTTIDEILSTANTGRIPLSTNWTLFTRFKALTVGSSSQQYVVLDESRSGTSSDSKFRFSYNTSVQPTARVYDTTGASVTAVWGSALSTGAWHNAVMEFNATNKTVSLTMNNGSTITSSPLSGVFNSTTSTNSALGIGGLDGAAAGALPNAIIDTTYFWSRLLTTAEKTELQNSGNRTVIQLPLAEGEANDGLNLGGGAGIFAQKNALDLEFKSLVAGTGVTITESSTEVTINSSASSVIDDATPSTNTVYSSTKSEADFAGDGSNTDITSMSGLGLEPFALASVSAPGTILISTNASSFPFVQFPVGSDGQVLTADSFSSNGVSWTTISSGGGGGGSGFLQLDGLNNMVDDSGISWGSSRNIDLVGDSSVEDLTLKVAGFETFKWDIGGITFPLATSDTITWQSPNNKISYGSSIMSFHISGTNQFSITTNLITTAGNLTVGGVLNISAPLTEPNGGTGRGTYTKGDLLVSDGANSLTVLGIGSNGQVLTADSTTGTGTKWAAAGAGIINTNTSEFGVGTSVATGTGYQQVSFSTSGLLAVVINPGVWEIRSTIMVESVTGTSGGLGGAVRLYDGTTLVEVPYSERVFRPSSAWQGTNTWTTDALYTNATGGTLTIRTEFRDDNSPGGNMIVPAHSHMRATLLQN